MVLSSAILLLITLFSCKQIEASVDCVTEPDLVERWLEVDVISSFKNCYLLSSDGLLLEKNLDTVWVVGVWEKTEADNNCIYEAKVNDEIIEFLDKDSECLTINYQSKEVDLCDCTY